MELLSQFEKDANKELIKYLCSKHIFCKYSQQVLDYRTAIVIEMYKKGEEKLEDIQVVSPVLADKFGKIKEAFEKKGYIAKFITLNKNIQLSE